MPSLALLELLPKKNTTKPHITAGSSGGVAGLMGFTLGISLHRFRMLLGLALGEPRRLQRSLPRGGRHGLEL